MKSQAHRPAPVWVGLLGLIGYAVVAFPFIVLGIVLLLAMARP